MSSTTPNMGLVVWSSLTDPFNHTQLANNFSALDAHDHTTGKGVQIPSGGIASLAVTTAKIADGAVTAQKLAAGALQTTNFADSSITTAKLANQAVNADKIATLPSARVYSSSAFSVPNSTLTAISFTTARFRSPTSMWDVSTPTQLIAPQSGLYLITGSVHWASSSSGTYRHVGIMFNGTNRVAGQSRSPSTSASRWLSTSALWHMSAGEYVELVVQQDSGTAQNIEVVENGSMEFAMSFVSL
jgi:hypothetical protein